MALKHNLRTQPQLAQLDLQFNGPLVKDSQVDTFNDLLNLQTIYAYQHKIVWVIDEQTNYFLDSGDGSLPGNWKRIQTRAVISSYDQDTTYQQYECIYLGGKIYSASQQVPKYYTPLSYPDYWTVISGETVTKRFIFDNIENSVIFYTEIVNPNFEVVLCDFIKDQDGNIVIDPVTGLVSIENLEVVEAQIIRREDLPQNNGTPYELAFYVNEELPNPVELYSGVINIK